MSTTPRFDALFAELCGLDAAEAQLPLQVLANLNRARLCAPLRGMAGYVGDLEVGTRQGRLALRQRLKETYGLEGELLETQVVLDLYGKLNELDVWAVVAEGLHLTSRERELVKIAEQYWLSYDPLVWFCFLAHRELPQAAIRGLIEAELEVQPDTHRLVLDMAALAEQQRTQKTN